MTVGVWVCIDISSSTVLTKLPVLTVAGDIVALSPSEGGTDRGNTFDGLLVVVWEGISVDSEILFAVGVKPNGLSVGSKSMIWGEGVG